MILVSGYYGFGNLGDEAILQVLCEQLLSLGVRHRDIWVLSGSPQETCAQHGVNAVHRYDLSCIVRILGPGTLLVSGGGSLLQDATGWRSVPYYLGIIELALRKHSPVVLYGQGVGPVKSRVFQRWIARVYGRVTAASVRDNLSQRLLARWGCAQPPPVATDPVFGITPPSQDASPNGFWLNVRPHSEWAHTRLAWGRLLAGLVRHGHPIGFVALGPGDGDIGRELQRQVPDLVLIAPKSVEEALLACGSCRVLLTMRLHGLIFAAVMGQFTIGLAYDPKVQAIGGDLNVPVFAPIPNAALVSAVEVAMAHPASMETMSEAVRCLRRRLGINRSVLAQGLAALSLVAPLTTRR